MISGDLHVDAQNYTSVFHTSVAKSVCSSPLLCGCYVIECIIFQIKPCNLYHVGKNYR